MIRTVLADFQKGKGCLVHTPTHQHTLICNDSVGRADSKIISIMVSDPVKNRLITPLYIWQNTARE